jgi:Flp pilus assembly protein TadG
MLFSEFLKHRTGGVGPLVALSAIPLFGAVGAAVDYSRANAAKAAMQAAVDSTALALSKDGSTPAATGTTASGEGYFKAAFTRPEVYDVQVASRIEPIPGGYSAKVSASGSVKTTFATVIGIPSVQVSASAVANAVGDGKGCILALNRHDSGAITAQGNTKVALNGCSLYDNSSDSKALLVNGTSARISALFVGVVGDLSAPSTAITATYGIRTGIGPVPDPYAHVSVPEFGGCREFHFRVKTAMTINPGVYCGGVTFNAGADVTLNPGIYYINQGTLTINGGAKVVGKGVTFVFTSSTNSNWATATIKADAVVDLSPPDSGPTAGIVMLGDRRMPVGTSFVLNGGASQYLGGAVYLPAAAITFNGGMDSRGGCTQIIGDTITFSGNSNLDLNCESYGTKPMSPLVVKLAS